MENPTHSRHPNMISKKTCNGASNSIYDDVYGGPPKFGAPTLSPRVEDYSEIFGGFHSSRASSIPVLDLPSVDDEPADVFFDVRSSGFDYTEVFGGVTAHDFAASYEDLMIMMDQSNGRDDSSDDAWTPAAADNLSEESDHSAKNRCSSNGYSSDSIDGCMEFNISYNKASKNYNEDSSNGIRHTTKLHDVSGYTFMVDKTSSLPNTGYLQARDDDNHLNIDYSGEMLTGSSDGLFFGDDVGAHREFVRNGSMFLTISDVSLRTHPSHLPPPCRPPPPLGVEKRDSGKTTPICRSVASEESAGDSSPPYFDVEVDASSSAVASAAAMKDAMKNAQAKLKSAKESMERKREASHSRTKLDSKNSRSNKEEKMSAIDNGFGSVKGKGGEGSMRREEDNGVEFSITEEKQRVKKTRQMNTDSMEGKYCLNMGRKSEEENQGRGSLSSQGSDFIDVAGEWKEATQFFELVTNKSKKIFDQENGKTVLENESICHERPKKEKRTTGDGLQGYRENGSKFGADHELEYPENNSGLPIRGFEHNRSVRISQEACREERNEKKFSIDLHPGETEKRRIRAYDLQKHSDSSEVIEKASRKTMKHKDKGSQWKEDNRSMGNVKKFPHGKEDSERRLRNDFQLEENEKKFNTTYEPAENEIRLKIVSQREETEKTKKAVCEREENEQTFREAVGRKESERGRKEALKKEDNERGLIENSENEERLRRQREATEQEENEKRQKETHEREAYEKRQREFLEREANEKRLTEAKNKEEKERRLKENLEKEETQRRQRKALEQKEKAKREREENEKRLKQALEMEEMERMQREAIEKEDKAKRERQENEKKLKQALEKEEMQRRQREAAEQEIAKREKVENEMRLKEALEKEENRRRQKAAVRLEKNEKKQEQIFAKENVEQQFEVSKIRGKEAFQREEIVERMKEACNSEGGKRLEEVRRKPENYMTSRHFEEVKEIETGLKADEEPETITNMSEAKCKWKETKTKHVDASENENQTGLKKMGNDYIELDQAWMLNNEEITRTAKISGMHENSRELETTKEIAREETSKLLSGLRNGEAEVASGIFEDTVEHGKMLSGGEDVTVTEQKTNKKINRNFQASFDTGNQGVKFPYEGDERGKNNEHLHQEHNKLNFMSAGAVKEPIETGRKIKGAHTIMEVKGSNQTEAQQVQASQSTERKVKNDTLSQDDKESERMRRERDLELERLRKLEEEREREREREKDRMAVDRTILETRDRAYAEARERAERAASEVRQRALNDARERLEKVCAEAREKSFPDNKASTESRLRAERAAVERATAEARERAFVKAMAERTPFEARDQVERSVSDKFSASRNTGIRPNSSFSELQDQQSQDAATLNGSKYQYSSVNSERFGVESESPQRCKARLERHRRTAERAAKALEEKNMRDLYVQREQAERNRLAETLDADVKRWSSGKEGNLRALLSTLQYILGAESGWQPIPLTEVITAAAVKKAYRKATLCVHPDKLQQRGATIHQKYICEKVFDLLKEAWNRFNSEER